MRFSKTASASTSFFVLLAFAAGCTVPTSDPSEPDPSSNEAPASESPSDDPDAPATPSPKGPIPFTPSNLAEVDFTGAEDMVLPARMCRLNGDWDTFECGSASAPIVKMQQADGTDLAVLVVKSLTVPGSTVLSLEGGMPLVIAAKEAITIHGQLVPAKHSSDSYAGGSQGGNDSSGPGGGVGGAGGSFCGKGGHSWRSASMLGRTYGSETLQPLIGGSAGGGDYGGGGGGGLQLVASVKIHVGLSGSLNLAGRGAPNYGSSGGGSGGAILLEAPEVRVDGVLAANGGGGGAHGFDGLSSDSPAGSNGSGGSGAAGTATDGQDGTESPGLAGGGGGGGAGRIRINTATGKVTLGPDAIISPALTTPCATEGTLAD
jgi:hypothetical protein